MQASLPDTAVVASTPDNRRGLLTWVWVGLGLIALSIALMPFDLVCSESVARFADAGTVLRRVLKLPYHFFARWGFVAIPLLLLIFRDRWRLLVGFAVPMAVGASVHGLKFLVGRARPQQGSGPYEFHPFGDPRLHFDSYPSAHAVYAAMLAALLGIYFPRWRPVLILLAIMVCVARVAQERHFVSDVCAGAGLGIVIVYLSAYWLGQPFFHRLTWSPTRTAHKKQ